MTKDCLMLADIIGRADFLEIRCGRCERSGRLSVARLAQENPPETSLAPIMRAQIGDCPKKAERRIEARCDPYSRPWGHCSRDHRHNDEAAQTTTQPAT
jgi:hypothetical protein